MEKSEYQEELLRRTIIETVLMKGPLPVDSSFEEFDNARRFWRDLSIDVANTVIKKMKEQYGK